VVEWELGEGDWDGIEVENDVAKGFRDGNGGTE